MKNLFNKVFMEADGGGGGGAPAPEVEPNTPEVEPNTEPIARINMFDDEGNKDTNGSTDKDNEEKLVPEKYEYELPEGIEITPEIDEKFSSIAKELNLTQEQANKLVGLHTSILQSQMQKQEEIMDSWAKECKNQGLVGREQMANAVRAVNTFGGGEFRDMLVQTGLQNHPSMQKFLQNIGDLIKEDDGSAGDNHQAKKELNAAELFFKNSQDFR
ncbi:MAG: hypothetical protein RSC33_07495 [Vagococcus sp.]